MNEYKCTHCNGYGRYYLKWKHDNSFIENIDGDLKIFECFICKGSGKINWLENIFQKERKSKNLLHVVELDKL
jgi:hypothetical protein